MTMASSASQSVLADPFGQNDPVVGTGDAGRRLVEDDRLGRDIRADLRRVIGIVQPDGDEVARSADTGTEAWSPATRAARFRDR